jgi:hypothetical protein
MLSNATAAACANSMVSSSCQPNDRNSSPVSMAIHLNLVVNLVVLVVTCDVCGRVVLGRS